MKEAPPTSKKRLIEHLFPVLQFFICLVFVLVVPLSSFNNLLSDLRFKLHGAEKTSGNIVIVAIDEESLRFGRWPWRRDLLAILTERVFELGARNVGFDILFPEKHAEQARADAIFAETLKKHASQITLGVFEDENKELHQNIDLFSSVVKNTGFVNSPRSADGVFRIAQYYLSQNPQYPSLALALVSQRLGRSPESLVQSNQSPIRYLGPKLTFPHVSASDLLTSSEKGLGEVLKDKTVIIGVTATGATDIQPTPLESEMPGVEVQATIADQILTNRIPKTADSADLLLSLVVLVGLLVMSHKFSIRPFLLGGLGSVCVFAVLDFWVLFSRDIYLNSAGFYCSAGLVLLSSFGLKYYEQDEQKRFIRRAFSKYLAPDVVKQLLEHPEELKLGGEKRVVTVLFCDLRNFTSLSETLEPTLLTQLLNETFSLLSDIVFKHHGTVDKYIGDALMAFFGAPIAQTNHAYRACEAAKEMALSFQKKQSEFKTKYGVELSLGIGINTGVCLVGNIGSETRFNYSVLGDSVNIAARVESCNKDYGTNILVTQAVLDACKEEDHPIKDHRFVDQPVLKGRSTPTALFELVVSP